MNFALLRKNGLPQRYRAHSRWCRKEGINTGFFAINPINGKKVPIWIADYILTDYGTGAIMGVPAHDQRDFDFARKYSIPVITVVRPADGAAPDGDTMPASVEEQTVLPATRENLTVWRRQKQYRRLVTGLKTTSSARKKSSSVFVTGLYHVSVTEGHRFPWCTANIAELSLFPKTSFRWLALLISRCLKMEAIRLLQRRLGEHYLPSMRKTC